MGKLITRKILFAITLIVLCSTSYGIEINLTKMLNPTNSSGSEKMFATISSEKYSPEVIVLHYTVTNSVDQTINTFYDRGVSSHFIVDRDGHTYQTVAPNNVAYHAGESFWKGNYSVNWNSIGEEQINTGDAVNSKPWISCSLPSQNADGRPWEIWPKELIGSTAALVGSLIEEHRIKPWNIIGHSDCAPDRKIDPGPLFPWKKLHDEYHVGFWPEEDSTIISEQINKLNDCDYMHLLLVFGYPIHDFAACSCVENTDKLKKIWGPKTDRGMNGMNCMSNRLTDRDTIRSFQYHYMQDKLVANPDYRTGKLDDVTKLTILKCIKSIMKQIEVGDYSWRMLKKMHDENKFSDGAKNILKSFDLVL